jgi:hypothetical protein
MDYCVWEVLSTLVYENRREAFASLAELQEAILRAWDRIPKRTLTKATEQFKKRIRAVVESKGGFIKHAFG